VGWFYGADGGARVRWGGVVVSGWCKGELRWCHGEGVVLG